MINFQCSTCTAVIAGLKLVIPVKIFHNQKREKNVILNREYYNPTLHAMFEWAVIGDTNHEGLLPGLVQSEADDRENSA